MHSIAIHLNICHRIYIVGEKMTEERKRQLCFRLEESIVKDMEQIREKTGVPVSTQIELRLKGYTICKAGTEIGKEVGK